MKHATIADAPAVLNTNDKAMWVLGFNAALTAQAARIGKLRTALQQLEDGAGADVAHAALEEDDHGNG